MQYPFLKAAPTGEPIPRCKCGRGYPHIAGPNRGKCGVCVGMPSAAGQKRLKGVLRCSR
jgi:hypothetical protein